jgi:hypothetical protein
MFASSPALSALEHPVYDLVVLDCVNANGAPVEDQPAGDQSQTPPAAGDKAKPADRTKQTAPAPAPQ